MQSPAFISALSVVRAPLSSTPLLRFTGYTHQCPWSLRQMAAWQRDTEGKFSRTSALRIRPTMFSQWVRS